MSPPVDHQHPCHQDDHELLLDADEILCGGFRSDTVNNRVLLRASLRPELRCKCGDKSQTMRGWCTSVNHSTSRKSCRRERYDKQTRGAATETTATTDSQDIPFQYHDDTSHYIQVYREQRLAAMTADDAIYSSNHVASSMAFSWPFLATYYKHSEWPHKTKLTKIMPARRQKTKLATIPNRMTVPVKECNVLEGLPKKTFLLCAEHMAIMNDALRKSKEAPGYNHNGDSTDRKQASGTNDTDNSLESIEQDDDINTSLVPIPVFMLPNMTRGTTIVPPKLGVDGRKILSSDDTDANVKKMKKRREPKQLCCFQQHYMDLSLPKLKPSWSNTQPLEKVLKHRLRKRHILRVASLPTRACASTSTFDDGNVSLLYRKQGRSNTEYRLAGSCNTDTNDLKRSIVLSKLSTSRNLTMKENVAHISKCELFTSNNM